MRPPREIVVVKSGFLENLKFSFSLLAFCQVYFVCFTQFLLFAMAKIRRIGHYHQAPFRVVVLNVLVVVLVENQVVTQGGNKLPHPDLPSTDCLSCHRQYCTPFGQEQRKDYKLYLHWGRVHPESTSSPKITEQKRQECLSEPNFL